MAPIPAPRRRRKGGRLLDAVAEHRILICSPDEMLAAAGHSVTLVRNGTLPDLPETIGITKEVGPL